MTNSTLHVFKLLVSLLDQCANKASPKHTPQPRVVDFLGEVRPDRVLLLLVFLETAELLLTADRVASFLAGLRSLVTAKVAKKTVVGETAEELNWCEHVGCVEKEREGEVD